MWRNLILGVMSIGILSWLAVLIGCYEPEDCLPELDDLDV